MARSRTALHVPSLALAFALAALPAAAQLPRLPGAATPAPPPTPGAEVAPDSPRSALTHYFALCRQGRYAEAARYLEVPPGRESEGPELSRMLKAVLDRRLWVDLTAVSPLPQGRSDDGLGPNNEEVGSIGVPGGKTDPVRLVRKDRPEGATWVFTQTTVSKVPGWYAALEDRRIMDRIPRPLLRPGPKELLLWQWLAVLGLAVPAWLVATVLGWGTRKLLLKLASRTRARWDEAIAARTRGPFTLIWMLVLCWAAMPLLRLYAPAEAFMLSVLKAGAIVAFFWSLLRIVVVSGEVLSVSEWARKNPAAPSLLSVGVKTGEMLILVFGAVASLSAVGFNVAGLLAGLGIGGIAVALAATKTFENLLGSISIGVDQPLRVGDWVKVGDVSGTVERIGLRSTGIRTLDRTVVTFPNGKLADMQVETFAPRERIRLHTNIGVEYGTSAAQLRTILAGVEAALRSHPKIWTEMIVVKLSEFRESSVNIEVMAWFETADMVEFRSIREEMLLAFMEAVEKAGASFAFPTRKVHVVGGSLPPG